MEWVKKILCENDIGTYELGCANQTYYLYLYGLIPWGTIYLKAPTWPLLNE